MRFEPFDLPGLVVIHPKVHEDHRGFFMESYRKDIFADHGIGCEFVQDNHVRSSEGTLRGLHFQTAPGQAKLLRCTRGAVWDVAVDIRPESPTFGRWAGLELSESNRLLFFVPVGFAHGYAALTDTVEMHYKVSNVFNASTEGGVAWDDADIGVDWKVSDPILSPRDRSNPRLKDLFPQAARWRCG